MPTGIFVSLDSGDADSDMYTYVKTDQGSSDTDCENIRENQPALSGGLLQQTFP